MNQLNEGLLRINKEEVEDFIEEFLLLLLNDCFTSLIDIRLLL
jgi:hypothetical protein